jgi:hypothetical protein
MKLTSIAAFLPRLRTLQKDANGVHVSIAFALDLHSVGSPGTEWTVYVQGLGSHRGDTLDAAFLKAEAAVRGEAIEVPTIEEG